VSTTARTGESGDRELSHPPLIIRSIRRAGRGRSGAPLMKRKKWAGLWLGVFLEAGAPRRAAVAGESSSRARRRPVRARGPAGCHHVKALLALQHPLPERLEVDVESFVFGSFTSASPSRT
jgi:hypothetical protein